MVLGKIKTKLSNKAKKHFLSMQKKELQKAIEEFQKGLVSDPRVKEDYEIKMYYEQAIEKTRELIEQIDKMLSSEKISSGEFKKILLEQADFMEEVCNKTKKCDPSIAGELRKYVSMIR